MHCGDESLLYLFKAQRRYSGFAKLRADKLCRGSLPLYLRYYQIYTLLCYINN